MVYVLVVLVEEILRALFWIRDVAIANAEQRVDHEGINGFGGGDILRCLVSGGRGLASKNVPDLTGFGWRA